MGCNDLQESLRCVRSQKGRKTDRRHFAWIWKKPGAARKSKSAEAVSNIRSDSPKWFKAGVEAALLAPTAMNQQKFTLTCHDSTVSAKAGNGFYTKIDLGIVKYHFEIGAGKENFDWK